MYANPVLAEKYSVKINSVLTKMAKLPLFGEKWSELHAELLDLYRLKFTARMRKDDKALTYR